jgi:hypothetical protein
MGVNNLPSQQASRPISPELKGRMQSCPQNPRYHAEGDVWAHTELVLEQFYAHKESYNLTPEEERILYWACLLHDVGKPLVTRSEQGRITSSGHEYAGVHIARNELLLHSELTQAERLKVLDVVRWHFVPFRWGREERPIEAYVELSYQTDLKLLAIFSLFDFHGRKCENQKESVAMIDHFARRIEPEIRYHHGAYDERKQIFSQFTPLQKDAFWYALRNKDFKLAQKLLNAPVPEAGITYKNVLHFLWTHQPEVAQARMSEHHPEIPIIQLSDFGLRAKDEDVFSLDRRTTELSWHVNLLSRHYPELALSGEITTEPIWSRLTEICRRQRVIPVLHSIEKPRDIQYKDYAYDFVSLDDIQDFHLMNPHPFAFHEIREL